MVLKSFNEFIRETSIVAIETVDIFLFEAREPKTSAEQISQYDKKTQNNIHNREALRLQKDEESIIKNHTRGSRSVNSELIRSFAGRMKKGISAKAKKSIKSVDSILNNASLKDDMHVYTAVPQSPHDIWTRTRSDRSKSVVVHLPAYTSTTTNFNTTKDFTKSVESSEELRMHKPLNADASSGKTYHNQTYHVLKLHMPRGTKAASVREHSLHSDENEILLHRGHDIEIHPQPTIQRDGTYIWHARVIRHNPKKI